MALPNGWNPGDECPECGSRVWDNRGNKRNPKAPDFKCSNADCQGGNGRPWAAWADAPKQGGGRIPAQQAKAPAPAPTARVTMTSERFWSLMTDALVQAKQALATADVADPAGANTQDLAAQFFILIEHGTITVSSTGPTAKAKTERAAQTDQGESWYLERLDLCTTIAEVEAIQDELRRDVKDKVLLASLLAQALKLKRAMSMKGGAA